MTERQDVLDALADGNAIWCCANMLSRRNPWWIVTSLDCDDFKQIKQITPKVAIDLVRRKEVQSVDCVPPISSWRYGVKVISWSGYIHKEPTNGP